MDAESASDFANGFALFEKPLSEFSLIFIHLLWSSKANPAPVCIFTAGSVRFG